MNDETAPNTVTSDGQMGDGAPVLDERAFIKAAKRRSTRRIVLISGAVIAAVVVILLAGAVWWQRAIYNQEARILAYYPTLVSISCPNTTLMYPEAIRSRFPGAVSEYIAYRPVGDVALPAGEASVEFDVWGGEVTHGVGEPTAGLGSRLFSGTALAPTLRFLEPAARGGASAADSPEAVDMAAQTVAASAKYTQSSLARLSAAPPSSTVEVAVSFRGTLTLREVEALLGPNLDLYWGATDAYPHPSVPSEPSYGHMVGVAFVHEAPGLYQQDTTHRDSEQQLIPALKQVAQHAPRGTATLCLDSAAYLHKNGVRYFGVVVCGSPKAALKLSQRPEVTAVSLGAVVPPWE